MKMAYILKRNWKNKTTYRVQVTRKGFKSDFKTFPTRTDAKKWGRTMENKLDRGDYCNYSEASKLTFLNHYYCFFCVKIIVYHNCIFGLRRKYEI